MPSGYPKDPEAYRARQAAARAARRTMPGQHAVLPLGSLPFSVDVPVDLPEPLPKAKPVKRTKAKREWASVKEDAMKRLGSDLAHATQRVKLLEAEAKAYSQQLHDQSGEIHRLHETRIEANRVANDTERRLNAVLDLLAKTNRA